MATSVDVLQPIHPFPGRMAPDIALKAIATLEAGSRVVDPMCGSGTVLKASIAAGHDAIGFDCDPLAVLMSSVWTTPIEADEIAPTATQVVQRAHSMAAPRLPWIDDDVETRSYVDYWFAPRQQHDLRRLVAAIPPDAGPMTDALFLALSRTIVTKDRGASLARDVSHSRPHRVALDSDFDVMKAFVAAARRLSQRLEGSHPEQSAHVRQADARELPLGDGYADMVITSPPYLNALDYIRGHRLSLVWMGWPVSELRPIRSESIGSERSLRPTGTCAPIDALRALAATTITLPGPLEGIFRRYVLDLSRVLSEVSRVLRIGGTAVLVVANSTVRGIYVDIAELVTSLANRVRLSETSRYDRELPADRRYLPPPSHIGGRDLTKRMKTEIVLTFTRTA